MVGKKIALVVAVSDYSNNIHPLPFCKNDGEKMYQLLKSLGYEIPESNKLVGQVNSQTMRDTLSDFFTQRGINSKDTLLFYFSGHGLVYNDKFYLATSEIDPYQPFKRGIEEGFLKEVIDSCPSTKIIMILDSCHSGSANPFSMDGDPLSAASIASDTISKMDMSEGRFLLASCKEYQNSFGAEAGSRFTKYVIEGLKGNKESVNKDGYVTPDSLARYVHAEMMNNPEKDGAVQKPIKKVTGSGDIILAEYPQFKSRTSEKIDNEHKERGMELIQAELEGLKNEIEEITQIRKKYERDLHKIKIKSKRSIAHASYRKDKLLGFTTIYGKYFTPIMDVIPEICQNVELFVNAVDENDGEWYFNFFNTIENILDSFPSYKEKMSRLPKVVPPGKSHLWLTCENCGQYPGFNIVTTDDGTFLQCGNCKHTHKGDE